MNEDLTNRILQYLEFETNYAIIINGKYGIGKTHYIKNDLFPKIKEKQIPNSTEKETYYPILISLFGINSIDEIQNKIIIELYPILKNRGVKIAAGLGNSIIKYLSGQNLKELISELYESSDKFVEFSKILLCIDDIDRKSNGLDLNEVFGFVNNLVENLNAKIILIANENELKNGSTNVPDSYFVLKEKVIGVSINFSSNVSTIFEHIIKSKYQEKNKTYFDFLVINKKLIVKRIEQNNDNLRTLIFFLEHFKIIYSDINEHLLNKEKFTNIKNNVLLSIIEFTLPIAIEYKIGKLNATNFDRIQEIYQGEFGHYSNILNLKEEGKTTKTYIEEYREKYFIDSHINKFYSNTIFQYITGSSSFQIENLSKELDLIYKFEDNKIPKREQILHKLTYWSCVDLSFQEYSNLTYEMLNYVDKGDFTIEQYPLLFNYAIRFNNLLKLNIEKLKTRFKKGILKGKNKYEYVSDFHFSITIDNKSELRDDQIEIREFCKHVNDDLKIAMEKLQTAELLQLYLNDFDSFINKINNYNNEFSFTPLFIKFDFNTIWKKLLNVNNSQIINFGFYLRKRYQGNIHENLIVEKEFLTSLEFKIKKVLDGKKILKMKIVAFEFLHKIILESIRKFIK